MIIRRTSLAALALSLGCTHTTEPRPTAPVVLLQTYYRFGPCGAVWYPSTPPVQRTVVDFHWLAPSVTAQQIQAVERGGGVVLSTFDEPVLRVAIDLSDVPVVMRGPAKPYYAQTVSDTTDHSPALSKYFCAVTS